MKIESESCGIKVISYSFNSKQDPPESNARYSCDKKHCPLTGIMQTDVVFRATGQNMDKSKLEIDREADRFFRAKCPFYAKGVKEL
jgi:hypothetical protein